MLFSITIAAVLATTAVPSANAGAPDVSVTAEDPSKFFLFHGSGLPIDTVRADLSYCIEMSKDILSMRDRMGSSGGILGAMLGARFAAIDRFRMRNAAMRKCMGMLDYSRYQVPEAEWNALVERGDIVLGNDGQINTSVIERMARFAAGPVPAGPRLAP